ncbi:hypothetical protein CKO27_21210 [Thiocystis violacea]|nr:hypothetical protein [Thiocystis violacea]
MSMRFARVAMVLVVLGSTALGVAAAELRVQLDRQRIDFGEVLEMRLSAEGELEEEPDFAPLNQDFDILGRGQSQVTSIVNGKISHTREWNLRLSPKRVGRLTIPPIPAGQDRSPAVTVEVVEPGAGDSGDGPKPLFVEAEVETATPYVQQAVEYRVKVYYRQPPQRAVLSPPQLDGATVQTLGEDRGYDEYREGLLYRVIERRYRVTPQRSGQILIQSPRLEAMLEDPNAAARQDPFADLDQAFGGRIFQGFPAMPGVTHPGRRVVERARDLELQVRPQPAGSGSPWLPATSIQISDEWTPSRPRFRVGEPLTRTLTITAEGTTAAQLPTLELGALDGVQVYPDQPRGEDLADGPTPSAIKSLKVALVPTRAGTLTLPEIRLPWWDTQADQARVVVVPARTVEVEPAPGAIQARPEPDPIPLDEPPAARPLPPEPASAAGDRASLGLWPWLALLLGVGWGLTVLWWFRERRRSPRPSEAVGGAYMGQSRSLAPARRAVEDACLANDPRAARAALIGWARKRWPDLSAPGLEALGLRIGDTDLQGTLRSIDRAIYAPPGEPWDGAAVWSQLARHLVESPSDTDLDEDPIPDLYPKV